MEGFIMQNNLVRYIMALSLLTLSLFNRAAESATPTFEISILNPQLLPEEPIELKAKLTNTGVQMINVSAIDFELGTFEIEVITPKGLILNYVGPLVDMEPPLINLAPGRATEITRNLRDIELGDRNYYPILAIPNLFTTLGTYTVRGTYSSYVEDGRWTGELTSNQIEFVIQPAPGTIEGIVLLEESSVKYSRQKGILVEVLGIGTTTTNADSYFFFSNLPPGTYTLVTDTFGASPLTVTGIRAISGTTTNIGTLSLLCGDGNSDGKINAFDIIVLIKGFGKMLGRPNWDPEADFNHDNRVNAFDIIVLRNNFGKMQRLKIMNSPLETLPFKQFSTSNTASLSLLPSQVSIKQGERVTIEINATALPKLVVGEFHLCFDPNVLEVCDEDEGKEGIQVKPGDLFLNGEFYQHQVSNMTGKIDYVVAVHSDNNTYVLGAGTIASITFKGKRKGVSAIIFDKDYENNRETLLITPEGDRIFFSSQEAVINVDSQPPSATAILVYPNPFVASGDTSVRGIIFDRLPLKCKVRIFNLAGELVKEEEITVTKWQWDLRNNKGEEATSGIYIYHVIDSEGNEKTGKIGVVR